MAYLTDCLPVQLSHSQTAKSGQIAGQPVGQAVKTCFCGQCPRLGSVPGHARAPDSQTTRHSYRDGVGRTGAATGATGAERCRRQVMSLRRTARGRCDSRPLSDRRARCQPTPMRRRRPPRLTPLTRTGTEIERESPGASGGAVLMATEAPAAAAGPTPDTPHTRGERHRTTTRHPLGRRRGVEVNTSGPHSSQAEEVVVVCVDLESR